MEYNISITSTKEPKISKVDFKLNGKKSQLNAFNAVYAENINTIALAGGKFKQVIDRINENFGYISNLLYVYKLPNSDASDLRVAMMNVNIIKDFIDIINSDGEIKKALPMLSTDYIAVAIPDRSGNDIIFAHSKRFENIGSIMFRNTLLNIYMANTFDY